MLGLRSVGANKKALDAALPRHGLVQPIRSVFTTWNKSSYWFDFFLFLGRRFPCTLFKLFTKQQIAESLVDIRHLRYAFFDSSRSCEDTVAENQRTFAPAQRLNLLTFRGIVL